MGHRAAAQQDLNNMLGCFNREFETSIAAKFLVTVGDEFQGILYNASIVPSLIWKIEERFTHGAIRVGIGYGPVDTALNEYAIGTDGPAWHNARAALEQAKKRGSLGGTFVGFGQNEDIIINGFSRLANHHRHSMTNRQRIVTNLLHAEVKQAQLAQELSVTPQAISNTIRSAGWAAYEAGEKGWETILRGFDSRTMA